MSGDDHELLPIIESPRRSASPSLSTSMIRNTAVHGGRLMLLACLLLLIHWRHERLREVAQSATAASRFLPVIQKHWPTASSLETSEIPARERGSAIDSAASNNAAEDGLRFDVYASDGSRLGTILQTAPASDRYLGFSGPTNLVLGVNDEGKIAWAEVASSQDTRDHMELIQRDDKFLRQWNGRSLNELSANRLVEGDVVSVAGATLTSLAIAQGVDARFRREFQEDESPRSSLRFPGDITLEQAMRLFPAAAGLSPRTGSSVLFDVKNSEGVVIGGVFRTAPAADQVVGYQGPTEVIVSLLADGTLGKILVARSFDNEPYVGYVRDDDWFQELVVGQTINDLAGKSFEAWGVEGVSGATMTSQAIARGLLLAATDLAEGQQRTSISTIGSSAERSPPTMTDRWQAFISSRLVRGLMTGLVVLMACVVALTHLRGHKWVRFVLQVAVLLYLGIISGELLSLAMFAGWAQSGIPWSNAWGLIMLSAAALLLPITARSNVYCSHICPHGVLQQWMSRHHHWRPHLPRWVTTFLKGVLPASFLVALVVALGLVPLSLVDLEPFDAYAWRAAGWATILIAAGGLMFSWFVPMGYCRFGCPTGSVLEYLRRHAGSGRLQGGDLLVVGCLLFAGGLHLWDLYLWKAT
ncbi:MAG: hypothetical protein C0478_15840 [Planctomyces sp.]|nr:hypothetical protein [Planctomyces sp.]